MGLEFTWLNSGPFSQVRSPGNKRDEDWYAGCAKWETPFSCERGYFEKNGSNKKYYLRSGPCASLYKPGANSIKQHWHMLAPFAKSLSFQSCMTAGMFAGTTGSLILRWSTCDDVPAPSCIEI